MTLIIWGIVVYKIVLGNKSPEVITNSTAFSGLATSISAEKDTFSLLLSYSDPFLKAHSNIITSEISNKKSLNAISRSKEQIQWPEIKYGGMIKNHRSKEKIALIRINNEEYLLREKEEHNQLRLLTIHKDSIIVVYQKARKTFYKI